MGISILGSGSKWVST